MGLGEDIYLQQTVQYINEAMDELEKKKKTR